MTKKDDLGASLFGSLKVKKETEVKDESAQKEEWEFVMM